MKKQYSQNELERNITSDEKNILNLEQLYMEDLKELFKQKKFSNSLNEIKNYINKNYLYIEKNYDTHNKINLGLERLMRFHIYRNYRKIKKVYSSPISSDIAFETDDAILNIDSKTLDKCENYSDFHYFHFEANQSSFKQKPSGSNRYYDGLITKSNLPSSDINSNKPLLTFVICLHYSDDGSKFNFYSDKKYKNLSLTCMPNGILSPLFKNDIIKNFKTYKYNTDKDLWILVGDKKELIAQGVPNFDGEFDSFDAFSLGLKMCRFNIKDNWGDWTRVGSKYGFSDKDNRKICWVIVNKGKKGGPKNWYFMPLISGSTARVDHATLKHRLDSENKEWLGYEQWNIEPKTQLGSF